MKLALHWAFISSPSGILAGLVGKICNVNTITSLIGWDQNVIIPNNYFLRFLCKNLDIITTTGNNTKNKLFELGIEKDKIFILPSIIDVQQYQKTISEKTIDIIYVGSLIRRKRVDLILQALSKSEKSFNLSIIGNGPEKNKLRKLSIEIGLEKQVTFHGYQKDVASYLSKSKILVLASESEGLPQVVMEAMSCGVPCVVPKVNDMEDIVQNGINSILYDQGNVEDLKLKIDSMLIDNKYENFISQSIQTSKNNFSIEAGKKRWMNILKQIKT